MVLTFENRGGRHVGFAVMRTVRSLTLLIAMTGSSAAGPWTLVQSGTVPAGEGVVFVEKTAASGGQEVRVHMVVPDLTKTRLAVVDNPTGTLDLADAMKGVGALAGVNGGYFHPDRTPIGLVLSGGAELHGRETAKLLSGFVAAKPGRVALLRVNEYRPGGGWTDALQAGPFLVDGAKPVAGLESTRRAARTALLWDGGSGVALVRCGAVTLAEAGELFGTDAVFRELRVRRALNLDGGSSAAMWVKDAKFDSPGWKPVRNYLAVVPRADRRSAKQ